MRLIANILSVLLHPIFIPTAGVYLLFQTPTTSMSFIKSDSLYYFEDEFKLRLFSLLAVLTIAAPLLSMVVLKTGKVISSYRLADPKERKAPLMMILVYLIIVIVQLFIMDPNQIIPHIVKTYILSIALSIGVISLLLPVLKISIHTAALSSLTALMIVYFRNQIEYNNMIIPSLFILIGIIGTCRLLLEEHNSLEIYTGAGLGFTSTFVLTLFF